MIKDKVIKSEKIEWRKLKWFQPDDLKEVTEFDIENLEEIIKKNGIIRAFKVWETKQDIKILDGHLLFKVLNNLGDEVPDKLQAEFIEVKNKKEAAEFVLLYSSFWHQVAEDGLDEFSKKYKINLVDLKINIPNVDMNSFKTDFKFNEKEVDENIETENECPKCGYIW